MNNNPENRGDGIDDILDILQKRKEQDLKNSHDTDNAPTRIDNEAIKVPRQNQDVSEKQESMFDDKNVIDFSSEKKTTVESETNANTPSTHQNAPSQKEMQASTPDKNHIPSSSNTTGKQSHTASSSSKSASDIPQKKPSYVAQSTSDSSANVSLDDFDTPTKNVAKKRKEQNSDKKKFSYIPSYVKVIIYLVTVFIVSILISICAINVGNDVFAFRKDNKEINITINDGATLSEVAKELEENGVIKYKSAFVFYAKIRMDGKKYLTGNFVSGTHSLNSSMNYDSLISELAESTYSNAIVRVTIPEGFTVYQVLDLLEEKRVINSESRKKMVEKLNDPSYFDYEFLPETPEKIKDENGEEKLNTEKLYMLEGYLFPDTYDFYVGENVDSIIRKFLDNFDAKFDESFYERAEELGMSVDEIITLASMIQAEGDNATDFYLISHVFHNRLNHSSTFPRLQSDATTLYYYQGEIKTLNKGDNQKLDNPYNTYTNNGLPPGAVCNPGHEAIYAALYPATYRVDDNGNQTNIDYYYFYTNEDGVTIFSRENREHEQAINN